MKAKNVLLILSDQHQKHVLGCYGNAKAKTPNLDALAARGTRFSRAYTTCPICVPARASLATGKYVHEIGNWDNAFPYDGSERTWHHELRDAGKTIDLIGKLHFRSEEDDNGFTEEHQPLHVVGGVGDPFGAIRWNPEIRHRRKGITQAGVGDSTYRQYDSKNADLAVEWLDDHADDERPWTLFLSFVCPHPPYLCLEKYFNSFDPADLPMPPQWRQEDWSQHPACKWFRRHFDADTPHTEEEIRNCIRVYYGMVMFLDEQIGRVLNKLEALGLDKDTQVIYSTDHGDSIGARGLFGKFTHYEESGGIPLILAGPGVPENAVCDTPASLLDIHATLYDIFGIDAQTHRDSKSLLELANSAEQNRWVFGEYHAINSKNGSYLLTDNRFKLIYHANEAPQLFDLENDPSELRNLSDHSEYQSTLNNMIGQLRQILDPEAVDEQAKKDQRALIDRLGGETAVKKQGFFENSPVPGETPKFVTG